MVFSTRRNATHFSRSPDHINDTGDMRIVRCYIKGGKHKHLVMARFLIDVATVAATFWKWYRGKTRVPPVPVTLPPSGTVFAEAVYCLE
jgi:hypothetical protein